MRERRRQLEIGKKKRREKGKETGKRGMNRRGKGRREDRTYNV